jgi:hypothetical protein
MSRNSGFERECFFISPIGEEGSPTRRRSDPVHKHIVSPAAKELGLKAVRADDLAKRFRHDFDHRPLAETGIRPGMRLEAIRPERRVFKQHS